MQRDVLIASSNSRYNQKTAEAISGKLSNISCDVLEITEGEILARQADSGKITTDNTKIYDICFGHPHIFLQSDIKIIPDGKEEMRQLDLQSGGFRCKARHFVAFSNCRLREGLENQNNLSWPAPISQLIFQIEFLLSDLSGHNRENDSQARDELETPDAIPDSSRSRFRLGMHLRIGSGSSKWLLEQIHSKINEGKQVYYLPLMPVYLMEMVSEPDKCGSNLSDLLLAIHQNCPPENNSIGIYTQMHPKGYLQFRPPDRADDILCCEPEDLRQLTVMLRQKADCLPGQCCTWIDCQGLQLSTVARLAVLCDCLAICIPHSDDHAARTARREIGLLMAKLPASCEIREIEGDVSYDA